MKNYNPFKDHLNLSNNIQDAARQIMEAQLNEAGLMKALMSGSRPRMKRETLRQKFRREEKLKQATAHGLKAQEFQTKSPRTAGIFQSKANKSQDAARRLADNIDDLEMQLYLDRTLSNDDYISRIKNVTPQQY